LIKDASFFGDPERLAKIKWANKSKSDTIFIDLDGVICIHESVPSYSKPLEVIKPTVDMLKRLESEGKFIVITTARDPDEEILLRTSLKDAGVPFSRLIMGVSSGTRHIINDRKPHSPFNPVIRSYEVLRDSGISSIDTSPTPEIVQVIQGNSSASLHIMKDHDTKFVRKVVIDDGRVSSVKIREQYQHLNMLSGLTNMAVSTIRNYQDGIYVGYDMEYLEGVPLSSLESKDLVEAIKSFTQAMYRDVYSRTMVGRSFHLKDYLDKKILSKIECFNSDLVMSRLYNNGNLVINGSEYLGAKFIGTYLSSDSLASEGLCTIHGDMTLENIFLSDGNYIFLDTDSNTPWDNPWLDLGKLFQSVVGCYEQWSSQPDILVVENENLTSYEAPDFSFDKDAVIRISTVWANCFNCSPQVAYKRGCFYAATHFLRMIPFKMKIDINQARFAMIQAIRLFDLSRKNI
jgi:hypothetical protein